MTHEEFAVERLAIIIHDAMCPDANGDMMTWPAEVFTTARAVHAAGPRRPRTITTAEELDALPVGSVVLRNGRAFQRYAPTPAPFGEYKMWRCGDGGFVRSTKDGGTILPATVLYEPGQP